MSPSPFHRYGVGGVINRGTRTPVFTVGFVIVHTYAGRQRQRLEDPPFIFNK